MIEIPEALVLSAQLKKETAGKTVESVFPPTKLHKFCWFAGDPEQYNEKLSGAKVLSAEGFGIFIELRFDNGFSLALNDGVNIRLCTDNNRPKDYQLYILFTDGTALAFTVAMYGGIVLHNGDYNNDYYLKSKNALSPFSDEYEEYYRRILSQSKPNLSAKAFLATEQRFPGIGNGVLQDVLFEARINPRRKLSSLSENERQTLFLSVVSVLKKMLDGGGRDTEKDIYGNPGGYITKMSKNTLLAGCPECGSPITKEAYLGGSVYYCPICQKM